MTKLSLLLNPCRLGGYFVVGCQLSRMCFTNLSNISLMVLQVNMLLVLFLKINGQNPMFLVYGLLIYKFGFNFKGYKAMLSISLVLLFSLGLP